MGNLVVTHIYLLLGCAFPLWVAHLTHQGGEEGRPKPNVFVPYAGVLALGIGDSAVGICDVLDRVDMSAPLAV